MQILILGAASTAPDELPIWLAEHAGGILVEHLVDRLAEMNANLAFAMLKTDVKRHHLDDIVQLAAPGASLISIDGATQGAACTALLCVEQIMADEELVIMNATEMLDVDMAVVAKDFRARSLDAGVITFPSLHPRYSYVALDGDRVVQAAEKHPISRSALAGFFWFRRGADFITAAQNMIRKDDHVDGQFFVSLTLNEIILDQKNIGVFPIQASQYHPLKSKRQVAQYEDED